MRGFLELLHTDQTILQVLLLDCVSRGLELFSLKFRSLFHVALIQIRQVELDSQYESPLFFKLMLYHVHLFPLLCRQLCLLVSQSSLDVHSETPFTLQILHGDFVLLGQFVDLRLHLLYLSEKGFEVVAVKGDLTCNHFMYASSQR